MAQVIKIEVDPEDYERVKRQFMDLYDIADKTNHKFEIVLLRGGVNPFIYFILFLAIFMVGAIFGYWLAGI